MGDAFKCIIILTVFIGLGQFAYSVQFFVDYICPGFGGLNLNPNNPVTPTTRRNHRGSKRGMEDRLAAYAASVASDTCGANSLERVFDTFQSSTQTVGRESALETASLPESLMGIGSSIKLTKLTVDGKEVDSLMINSATSSSGLMNGNAEKVRFPFFRKDRSKMAPPPPQVPGFSMDPNSVENPANMKAEMTAVSAAASTDDLADNSKPPPKVFVVPDDTGFSGNKMGVPRVESMDDVGDQLAEDFRNQFLKKRGVSPRNHKRRN